MPVVSINLLQLTLLPFNVKNPLISLLIKMNLITGSEKILKLQKDQISLQKLMADIENKRSETARNIPEIEHLKSETILNLAKAREAGMPRQIKQQLQ